MYIETIPNRKSPPAILLRSGTRQGNKTVKKTHANLTHWPEDVVQALRRALDGKKLVAVDDVFRIVESTPHGHVRAILGVMDQLGIGKLLAPTASRERSIVLGLIAQRLINPLSKSAMGRCWADESIPVEKRKGAESTLAATLGIGDIHQEELYLAMDWLLERKPRIERKLADRHLSEGHRVLYDISSSSYYGLVCPLAKRGHNRDGQKLPSIVYGLLTDEDGCPVAIDVYAGNMSDSKTIPDQVEKIRESFGIQRIVLVGDRGMLTQTNIAQLEKYPEIGYLSALKSFAIKKLIGKGSIDMSLFDQQNLAEIESAAFPGERLVVCLNTLLREDRRRTRKELLNATIKNMEKLAKRVARRTQKPMTEGEIGEALGRIVNKQKMRKHIRWTIAKGHFEYTLDTEAIREEEQLDGLYVIRTKEKDSLLSPEDAVRAYKCLMQVEQAFRCLKSVDLRIRPIRHWTEDRVRAHIFLCMLSYYVEWHMRKSLSSVLFQDDELDDARWTRDPVEKAEPSHSVKDKKVLQHNSQGWPVCSFGEVIESLGRIVRDRCVFGENKKACETTRETEPNNYQRHIFELLKLKI